MPTITEDQMKEVFATFDKDNSGVIDSKEVVTAMQKLGTPEDEAKAIAQAMIGEADVDQDKKISWDEFKAALATA